MPSPLVTCGDCKYFTLSETDPHPHPEGSGFCLALAPRPTSDSSHEVSCPPIVHEGRPACGEGLPRPGH